MQNILLITALIGISSSGSSLSGTKVDGLYAESNVALASYVEYEEVVTEFVVYEEIIPVEEETPPPVIEEVVAEEIIEPEPVEEATEVVVEEELTYDQINQRDVGEEEPVPPEVTDSWYVEETAAMGLELIWATFAIPEDAFVIESTPSNYVYQYDFYTDSPDGGHVNLVGIYQYDATGNQLFQLDIATGMWE